MTTAVDGNVLIALWNEDDSLNALARSALDAALERGNLVIAAPVAVDWNLGQPVWRAAGRAFGNTPPAEKTARFWPAPHSYRFPDRRPRRAERLSSAYVGRPPLSCGIPATRGPRDLSCPPIAENFLTPTPSRTPL